MDDGFNPEEIDKKQAAFPPAEKPLRWIHGSKGGYQSLSCADVVTQKGVLKQIGYTISSPFKNSWKIEVCRYKRKLYIRYPSSDDGSFHMNEWAARNSYWGVKFEDYVIEPDSLVTASYKMLEGRIGNKKVLLSAEVDAVKSDGRQVEVKTCFPGKLVAKMPFTWIQSYLGKVDVLYYGWKNKEGIVSERPEEFVMNDIPGSRLLKEADANAMFGFLGDVIDWTYASLPDADEIWELEYGGGRSRQITLKRNGERFLPGWYLEFIEDSKEEDVLARKLQTLSMKNDN